MPVTVTTGSATYPSRDEILTAVGRVTDHVDVVPGVQIAEGLGNARAHNVVILGALSRHLDVAETLWHDVIRDRVPQRYVALNLEAFARGRAAH